ncbi:MAG: hypothetical protein AAGD38_23285 [Acidobacteriota bacterium]
MTSIEQDSIAAVRRELETLAERIREVGRHAATHSPIPADGVPRTVAQEIAGLADDDVLAESLARLQTLERRTDEDVKRLYGELLVSR